MFSRNEFMTLEKFISELQKLEKKHGGDIMVLLTDTHLNTLQIDGARFQTGSFDGILLQYK